MLVVMSVFREAALLPIALGMLPPDVPVMVVDGAYADYPHDHPYSTDGTVEIARAYGARVVEVDRAWATQPEKRTATLVAGEVVFVVDADEFVAGFPDLPDDADVGWVTVTSPIYREPYLEPRVFRVREGWHYDLRHHWIYDGDGRLVCSHRKPGADFAHAVLPVVIANRRDLRDPDRDRAKAVYGKVRNRRESKHASEV